MLLTWFAALLVSFGLRVWGTSHPEPFAIRPLLVLALLFGPSLFLGLWVLRFGFFMTDSDSSRSREEA